MTGTPKALRLWLEMRFAMLRRCVCKPCSFGIPVVADGTTRECGAIHHRTQKKAHWREPHDDAS